MGYADAIMDSPMRWGEARDLALVVLAEKRRAKDVADGDLESWVRNSQAVGLSQAQIASVLGVSQQAVSKRYGSGPVTDSERPASTVLRTTPRAETVTPNRNEL